MNTAAKHQDPRTVTARPYTHPEEEAEPGYELEGAAWALRALADELPGWADHDAPKSWRGSYERRSAHVWPAWRGGKAGALLAAVRAAADEAGLDLEVVS